MTVPDTAGLFGDEVAPEPTNRLLEPIDSVIDRLPGGAWRDLVENWRATAAAQALIRHIDQRVASGAVVYPAHVFRALELTAPENVRVVVVGQDPYHGAGQAQGLAFSVAPGVRLPPSLRNIFKEIERTQDGAEACAAIVRPPSGDLSGWARQGVLLLNTALTVEDGAPASHARRGWESLTDLLISAVAEWARQAPTVFMLWGAHAQVKEALVTAKPDVKALVLKANHPSPLSATRGHTPFIGCGHFQLANQYLRRMRGSECQIEWRLR